jgi:hypothetical protein
MPRAYGPHREGDAPATVLVRRAAPRAHDEVEVPLPAELQRQRAQINARAHKEGKS